MATVNNNNNDPFINQLLLSKISRVNTDIKQTINTSLSEFNLSVEQFNLLLILHRLPENKCGLLDMMNMNLMEMPTLLKSIKRLEIAGIVKRITIKPSEETVVYLTDKGLKTLCCITNYKELMDSSLEGLNIAEKKTLYHLLGKVHMPVVLEAI